MTEPSLPSATLKQAGEVFDDLTATEERLVECFAAGEVAAFDLPEAEDIALATKKRQALGARARVLRWLLANPGASQGAKVRGLHVKNVCALDEDLDLDGIAVEFPIILENCRLRCLNLRDARLLTLRLSGTHCHCIYGDRMRIANGLLLDEGFRSIYRTFLPAISVGDDLNCSNGRFGAGWDGASSLVLDGADIDRRLYLDNVVAAAAFKDCSEEVADEGAWPEKAGGVTIQGARIGGNLLCRGLSIRRSGRGSALNLQSTVVSGDGAFEGLTTNRRVWLRQTTFNGTLTFHRCKIAGDLNLTRATVGGDLDFGTLTKQDQEDEKPPAQPGSKLLLGGATISGKVDFGDADMSGVAAADFARSSMGFLDDRKTEWPNESATHLEGLSLGGIAVSTATPRSFRDWLSRKTQQASWFDRRKAWLKQYKSTQWSPQPYGQVAAALKLAGEDKLARKVSIERERERRSQGGLGWISQAWNALLYYTIGYGYKPYWAFIWAAAVILAGWGVFDPSRLGADLTPVMDAPHFYSLAYSADVFLPIVDLGQADAFTPQGLWPNIAYWSEISFGWLLTTLGIAGVSGLIRKE